jgi:hypothetical protein
MCRMNLEDPSNYPGGNGNTAAVYVEKLNRIYIFGGLQTVAKDMKTAFGISTYHLHRLPFLHSTAWAWCKEATRSRPTALRSSFAWMERWLGSSNALQRTSSTQSSRPVTSLNWSSASLVARSKGKDFIHILVTAVSTLSAEKGARKSNCRTVQSRYFSTLSNILTFGNQ